MDHTLGDSLTIEPSELLDEVKVFQKHRPFRPGGLRILIIAHRRTGILCHRCRGSKCGRGQQSHNAKYWEHAHDEVSLFEFHVFAAETPRPGPWLHTAGRPPMANGNFRTH